MTDLESYSDREFLAALKPLIGTHVIDNRLAPSDNPRAGLLGGQSGAGKTTLHDVFLALEESNAIVINGDDYRSVHPRFRQICAQYGIDSPAHTAAWAGRMVEAIVDALSIMGYNLIIEGTLRTSEVPLKTARLRSGDAHLLVSQLAADERYLRLNRHERQRYAIPAIT